jgi:hypothetical protein
MRLTIQKIHLQLALSERTPPRRGPITEATPEMASVYESNRNETHTPGGTDGSNILSSILESGYSVDQPLIIGMIIKGTH